MKVSIIIPQLFYDLIARILPGFLFLILIVVFIPDIQNQIIILNSQSEPNFIESLGHGLSIIVVCYFLGWLFRAFIFFSKEKKTMTRDAKYYNQRYQWIRLYNPDAGFRIAKLRAEARMLETTRTALVIFILTFSVYWAYSSFVQVSIINQDTYLTRFLTGLAISLLIIIGFMINETKAWKNYWGSISTVYEILYNRYLLDSKKSRLRHRG